MIEAIYFVDPDADSMARRAADYFLEGIRGAVKARGRARIAISGGSTPRRAFELLATAPFKDKMPWDELEIYWVDERMAPPDDPDSNYRMTREALLDHVPLSPERIFRIHGELEPAEAASEYESAIRRNFRLEGAGLPSFDMVALGMGPDGHTASLFPHSPALGERMRIAVENHVPAQKEPWRVTLTSPVINNARDVVFLIEGKAKAEALHRVLLGPFIPKSLPAQLISPRSGRITLLLDSQAASFLPMDRPANPHRLEIVR